MFVATLPPLQQLPAISSTHCDILIDNLMFVATLPLLQHSPAISTHCDILIYRCSLQPSLCCSTRWLSVLIVIYLYTDVRCNPPFVAALGGYQYSLRYTDIQMFVATLPPLQQSPAISTHC